jgi:UDP-N-acetylmuramoyl-tripeptide--D-alanyl-D-alanine ligase
MKRMKAEKTAKFAGGKLTGPADNITEGVETDSRKASSGSLFIGLVGESNDGNDFAEAAYENGCRVFMLSSENAASALTSAHDDASVILVDDTLKGMQQLAKNFIEDADIYRIAVTGSTGKTTTKEMLRCIFKSRYSTVCNFENFNNHIGVPLTAFQIENDTEAAIFEMGMNHKGEIEVLADIVRPETAVITNVGISHIGNLGSREDILEAKLEVTSFMDDESYLLIYNADNDMLRELNGEDTDYDKVRVGEKGGKRGAVMSDIEDLGEDGVDFTLTFGPEKVRFHIPVPGRHNAWNAALAIVCGMRYGISMHESAAALRKLESTGNRLNIQVSPAGIKVINDAYNASPDSVKAGIDVLMSVDAERKVAVLADMFELGDDSDDFHSEIGRYAAEKNVDLLITVGSSSEKTAAAAAEIITPERVVSFADAEAFTAAAAGLLKSGDAVLVKGSHGMHMEKAAEYIINMGA